MPRRRVTSEEILAGETVALLGLALVALLVLATNPFSLIFLLPALHAWLWLPTSETDGHRHVPHPAARSHRPVVLMLSFALRFGLGFDASWYLVELAADRVVSVPLVAMVLATGACGAQLAAASAGRYTPYPKPGERPARGPLREAVRTVVLTSRARRRGIEPRRRAVP